MTCEELVNGLVMAGENSEDLFPWFVDLNDKYNELKKSGQVSDELMGELVEFWDTLPFMFEEDIIAWLKERWGGQFPKMVQDITAFSEGACERAYKAEYERLDAFERHEADTLFEAIWNRETRVDINGELYDWDADELRSVSLTVPRLKRTDDIEYELRRVCAMIIYNRGVMVLRFFADRGRFEIAGINVPEGNGRWESMSKETLTENLNGGIDSNETVVMLGHDIAPAEEKLLYWSAR